MENLYLLRKKTIEIPASYASLLEGNGFFQVLLKHVDFLNESPQVLSSVDTYTK